MNKSLLLGARALSSVFRPQFFPLVGFVALFMFTYLSLLPVAFKAMILLIVALGTLLLPRLTIRVWRQMNHLSLYHLRLREKRFFPYLVHILYYSFTLHLLSYFHLPYYMGGILVGALMIQVSCTLINTRWKISAHCAGAGGVIGALMAYSVLFSFNPIWWLCFCILISGLVGSSRMLLRQHTLWQVVAGNLLGCLCGFIGIIWNF
jgi:membrane-associated phospholipid phosphatase